MDIFNVRYTCIAGTPQTSLWCAAAIAIVNEAEMDISGILQNSCKWIILEAAACQYLPGCMRPGWLSICYALPAGDTAEPLKLLVSSEDWSFSSREVS